MSTTLRHQNVRRLEAAAFTGATGREDILVLKQGIYEAALLLNILDVVALDADLATYELVRVEVLPRPPLPQIGATAAQAKHYEFARHAYTQQSEGLATLKGKIIQALDQEALRAVEQPIHGTLRLSVRDLVLALTTEYQQMTNKELQRLYNQWTALRWDAATDLITFLTTFQECLTFLDSHGFGPTRGVQVVTLQEAVEHVPAFANIADAAFHQEFPFEANQTLANLTATYRRVYRAQYAHSTAAQHHLANQVKETPSSTSGAPEDVLLQGISASTRAAIRDTKITPELMDRLVLEVTKTVQRCLRPHTSRDTTTTQRDTRKTAPSTRRPQSEIIAPGTCPYHRTTSHTWADCRANPDHKA